MKKLIALSLVLVMLLSLFAACGDDTETPAGSNLDAAVEYLKSMYRENDGSVTNVDYEVVGVLKVGSETFTVDWTSDKAEVQIIPNAETKMVTINVDESSPADVAYVLTATVKDAAGNSKTCTFSHTVPQFKVSTIKEATAMEDGTSVVLAGTVVSIDTAWSDSYKNITVTIKDAAGDTIQLYRLSTNVALGDILLVKGEVDSYNDKKQIAQGATAEITGKDTPPTVTYTKMTIAEALAAEVGTTVELSGTVISIDTPWSSQYKNITVTIEDASGKIQLYRLATEVAVGDIITVKGKVDAYNEKKQIAQGATAEITGKDTPPTITYTKMTITEALAAADGTYVEIAGTVVSIDTPWSDQYGNITVSIKDDSNGTIQLYRITTKVDVGAVLTVKGKVDSYNDKKQIAQGATVTVTDAGTPPEVTYEKMTIAEAVAAADGTTVEISGTVISIDTPWSTQYNNITVTIKDESGSTIQLYRLATEVALYDVVTVKGAVASYNSKKQIGQGATATITGKHTHEYPTTGLTAVCTDCGFIKEHTCVDTAAPADNNCDLCGKAMPVAGALTATVDLTAQGYENQETVTTVTADSVTVTFDKGTNSNAPKFYTSGNAVRVYGSNTVTIAVAEGYKISSITITFGSSDGTNEITASTGTLEGGEWTATDATNTVTLTVGGTKGNRRFVSIVVNYVEA